MLRSHCGFLTSLAGATKDMGKMLGGEEEKDPDAQKKEEERQEALRQQEEERKAKHARMEAEREKVRQQIRDKVRNTHTHWLEGKGHITYVFIYSQHLYPTL